MMYDSIQYLWFTSSLSIMRILPSHPHPPTLSRLAGYVEALASRLGMQIPDLSPKQADMWQTKVSSHSVCISIIRSKSQICFVAVVTEQNLTLYIRVWSLLHSKTCGVNTRWTVSLILVIVNMLWLLEYVMESFSLALVSFARSSVSFKV